MTSRGWTTLLVAGICLCSAGPTSAQILTENAGVNPPTVPTLREFLTYFESENLDSLELHHQFILGVTPKFGLSLTVPTILYREASFQGSDGLRASEELHGLGDISLDLKLSLFQEDGVLESTRWAGHTIRLGAYDPTGTFSGFFNFLYISRSR